jgi:hypothetical protein
MDFGDAKVVGRGRSLIIEELCNLQLFLSSWRRLDSGFKNLVILVDVP